MARRAGMRVRGGPPKGTATSTTSGRITCFVPKLGRNGRWAKARLGADPLASVRQALATYDAFCPAYCVIERTATMDIDRPLTRQDWERIVADVKRQNAVCLEQAAELTRLRAELR